MDHREIPGFPGSSTRVVPSLLEMAETGVSRVRLKPAPIAFERSMPSVNFRRASAVALTVLLDDSDTSGPRSVPTLNALSVEASSDWFRSMSSSRTLAAVSRPPV